MRRQVRRAAFAVLAAAGMLALPAAMVPAAADGLRVESVSANASSLSFVLSPTNGSAVKPDSVQVTLDGKAVEATVTPVTEAAGRRVLLVVPTGSSMGAPATRLAALRQGIDAYLKAVPADVEVGLLTYGEAPRVVVEPTRDRAALRSATADLTTAAGERPMNDAVALATTALGIQGPRSVVLVSDGSDEGSTTSAAAAAASLTATRVRLDAVSFSTDPATVTALRDLATIGSGRVLTTADPSALPQALTQSAAPLAAQLSVSVPAPIDPPPSVTLDVRATAGTTTVSTTEKVAILTTTVTSPQGSAPGWLLVAGLAILFVGLLGVLGLAAWRSDASRGDVSVSGRVRRRLDPYTARTAPTTPTAAADPTALGSSGVARSAVDLAGRVVTNREFDSVLARRLDAAGISLRPAEWLVIHVGFAIVVSIIMAVLFGFALLPTVIGLVVGVGLPWIYLSLKEGRRNNAFAESLAPTLQMLAGSLTAGYSLPQGIDTVVKESSGPMQVELNRALLESRLGVPLEDALEGVADRMRSADFGWVVMAIRIQREVGGNLAEVLNNVAATIRERERLRRQVKALSAEGRLSAYVLGGLPVGFALYLLLVQPDYLSILFTSPFGLAMIVVAVLMLLVGAVWLRKIVNVDV